MQRERFVEKLKRILKTVNKNPKDLPAPLEAVYVFGSFARGALKPHDLDLLVVHGPPDPAWWQAQRERLADRYAGLELECAVHRHFQAALRGLLRRPGERVDIALLRAPWSPDPWQGSFPRQELVLLWSAADRQWQRKLAALKPDPEAGRAERDEFFPVRRFRDGMEPMREVMTLIRQGAVVLTKIPAAEMQGPLSATHRELLADIRPEPRLWTQELIDHLPYALLWLQRCRQVVARPLGREMWSRQRTHRVELGRPWLSKLITVFTYQPRVRRQCLIPYFRRAGPNELLVFERGPNWSARQPPRGV